MNILVCVKQVPDTTEIRIDPVKNTLIRDGVPSILNPYDGYAMEAAARIKDDDYDGTHVVVVTMGPPQAIVMLKHCLALTADKAYLVSSPAFGGSDTLSTSYILSQAVAKIEELEGKFDIIFCGKQAIDGDTAQVGPELAEHLGYPQVTCALEAAPNGNLLKVQKQTDDGVEVIGVHMPCVCTFTQSKWEPRYPNIRRKMAARRAEIPVLDLDAFPCMDTSRIGLKGSPTKVKKTFVPQRKGRAVTIAEATCEASAKKLFDILHSAKIV